jgi:UDP-glucose 4-epimerase
MPKKKIAVVTGGAGFIGSHMVDLLLSKQYHVKVIDNFSGGDKKNLSKHLNNKFLKIYNLDIRNFNKIKNIFINAYYVFHFAGKGDIVPSIDNPSEYISTNVHGTQSIFEACRLNNVAKFIYAASSSCYGKTGRFKVSETYKISTEHPYALSKYLGEQLVLNLGKIYKLKVVSLRIFNAYGPRVKTTGAYGAVIGVFFKQKLSSKPLTVVGDGNQTRDFVHVKDVVNAFYLAAKKKVNSKVFNIGFGKPISVNYLANLINKNKVYIPDRPGEPRHTWANISKASKELKWKAKINFSEGIKEMLREIHLWKNAPLWNKKNIKKVTKNWFKTLK